MQTIKPQSLFGQLLLFLGLPLFILWGFSAVSSYLSAMNAATQAYDRTLLASTRTVAEQLVVHDGKLDVDVPWVVLDSFERNMNDRLYYKVTDTQGKVISGYDDLPDMPENTPGTELYPALAWFYDATYRGQTLRVARLLQPVNEGGVNGMAQIIVAETVQSRHYLAVRLLASATLTQGGLVLLTLTLAWLLLRRVLKPMRQLSVQMVRRDPGDLTPLPDLLPWSETRLLIVSFNRYIESLRGVLARQSRFSADASHQLRTPLTVLKTQAAVALSSPDPMQWRESLVAMQTTLDSTIHLTERLLQLSRLSRLDQTERQAMESVDLVKIAQACCFSSMAQARSKNIDLGYEGLDEVWITGEPVLLAEMCINLLDNALKYTPENGVVTIRVTHDETQFAWLEIEDSGPGIESGLVRHALMPFHRLDNSAAQSGAGIGLALVNDIARYHRTKPELLRAESGGLLVKIKLAAV
ncbi:sensor histidine kinase [Buttiauxella agrestis]|uniref:sensor histidine kinase n=1 Tax=Buttiauxella agrestis TaxID=82977 RepID=UPI0015607D04|nr:sensor histidine kinase [Buttiauxella agrestis]BCG10234.1 sensor histidine kinase [Buttiauxella agrestis]